MPSMPIDLHSKIRVPEPRAAKGATAPANETRFEEHWQSPRAAETPQPRREDTPAPDAAAKQSANPEQDAAGERRPKPVDEASPKGEAPRDEPKGSEPEGEGGTEAADAQAAIVVPPMLPAPEVTPGEEAIKTPPPEAPARAIVEVQDTPAGEDGSLPSPTSLAGSAATPGAPAADVLPEQAEPVRPQRGERRGSESKGREQQATAPSVPARVEPAGETPKTPSLPQTVESVRGPSVEQPNRAEPSLEVRTATEAPQESAANETKPAGEERPLARLTDQWAARAPRSERTLELNSAQQARFVERVARAFEAAEARGGTLRLRLHPPELGHVRLEMRVQDGALTARLEAENATARTILLDNLPQLRERLADQGVRVEQFEVALSQRQPGEAHDRQGGEQPPSRDHRPTAPRGGGDADAVETNHQRPVPWQNGDGQLDIRI